MNIPRHIEAYETKHALSDRQPVVSELGGIEQVVVIPALAEKDTLLTTLCSLTRNADADLRRTLVLCVINNRRGHVVSPQEIRNNQETLGYLDALLRGRPEDIPIADEEGAARLQEISRRPLRLAYVDASSPGHEMPDKSGGVGTARKIGLDAALRLFDYRLSGEKLLACLDADTLVEDNYLMAIRNYFQQERTAAVVNYKHQPPLGTRQRLAIASYEIFLRYYVLGLRYAGSPYAFHTIGSTMICTANAYVAVGGMNRRDAAEDFYFLNKLAKFNHVGRIPTTTVYPSARPSRRVPFGTGRWISRFLEEREEEWRLYDPRIFLILKRWLQTMEASPDRDTEVLMTAARGIDPLLSSYLESQDFYPAWSRVRKNSKHREGLQRHFHCWFDGFKTLKLVHFLTDHGFSRVSMFRALEDLFGLMGGKE